MTSATDVTRRPVEAPVGAGGGRWLMLVVLLAGQFMALLDVTIVNVGMPTIGRDLHASGSALQLVVAGYTVSYAMLLITGARLGDLYGRRRMFLTGVAIFTVSSLACGLAPGAGILITARFAQGAGAAAMMPQIISVIQARFGGAARARALSAYTAVLASGFVAGQMIGGVLVSANLLGAEWRPVFLVNVPIGVVVAISVPRVVPRDRGAGARRLDLAGLATAVPAVFLIVLPLVLGHEAHWPAWTFACLAAGLLLAAVFVWVEHWVAARGGDPLLNLRVLRSPGLVPGLAALALAMTAYGGFLFSIALHLQVGLHDSALRAGLTFAPAAAVFGLCGFHWRRLPVRLHHVLTPGGFLVAAAAYLALAADLRSGTQGGPQLQILLLAFGASMGLGYSPLVTHALVNVPLPDAADASGLLTTTLQLGQVIGVATFGSLFLTLAADPLRHTSGQAIATTMGWLAPLLLFGAIAGLSLGRTVARARRARAAQETAAQESATPEAAAQEA